MAEWFSPLDDALGGTGDAIDTALGGTGDAVDTAFGGSADFIRDSGDFVGGGLADAWTDAGQYTFSGTGDSIDALGSWGMGGIGGSLSDGITGVTSTAADASDDVGEGANALFGQTVGKAFEGFGNWILIAALIVAAAYVIPQLV